MNFEEAVKNMREGKKIRRRGWGNKSFYVGYFPKSARFKDSEDKIFNFMLPDFEATDWEVVDEDKDWNLATKCYHNVDIVCGSIIAKRTSCAETDNIIKCRDLIIKDLGFKKDCQEKDRPIMMSKVFVTINKRFGDL